MWSGRCCHGRSSGTAGTASSDTATRRSCSERRGGAGKRLCRNRPGIYNRQDHRPTTEGGRVWGGGVLDGVSGCEGNSLGHRPGQGQIRRPHRLPRVGPGGGHGGVLGVGARAVAGAVAAVATVGDAQFVGGEDADALLAQGEFVVVGVHFFLLVLVWSWSRGWAPLTGRSANRAERDTFSSDIWMTKTTPP